MLQQTNKIFHLHANVLSMILVHALEKLSYRSHLMHSVMFLINLIKAFKHIKVCLVLLSSLLHVLLNSKSCLLEQTM